MKKLTTLALFAGVLACGSVSATIINGTGLQEQLTRSGALVDVHNDQYNPDEKWQVGSTGIGGARLLFELGDYAPYNSFGIYDVTNAAQRLTIFRDSSGPGANGALQLGDANYFCAGAMWMTPTCATFGSNLFGFFLSTPDGTFFSELDRNADGIDHMVAFEGGYDRGHIGGNPWLPNEFILAWEDLYGGGDLDYDDFGVLVESVVSVSEPGTLALLGIACVMLMIGSRRLRTRVRARR